MGVLHRATRLRNPIHVTWVLDGQNEKSVVFAIALVDATDEVRELQLFELGRMNGGEDRAC
jgi:hypothetical protein